jgi:hypothetical protein
MTIASLAPHWGIVGRGIGTEKPPGAFGGFLDSGGGLLFVVECNDLDAAAVRVATRTLSPGSLG